jgi:hypothetical protein
LIIVFIASVSEARFALPLANAVETAQILCVFPQKVLRLLSIHALRNLEKVHHADSASGQETSFAKDLDARILIQRTFPARPAHNQQNLRLPVPGAELILKLGDPADDRSHWSLSSSRRREIVVFMAGRPASFPRFQ